MASLSWKTSIPQKKFNLPKSLIEKVVDRELSNSPMVEDFEQVVMMSSTWTKMYVVKASKFCRIGTSLTDGHEIQVLGVGCHSGEPSF